MFDESNTGEQMHNSENNKLILEYINRQHVNMVLFNATKKGSSTFFLDQNYYPLHKSMTQNVYKLKHWSMHHIVYLVYIYEVYIL